MSLSLMICLLEFWSLSDYLIDFFCLVMLTKIFETFIMIFLCCCESITCNFEFHYVVLEFSELNLVDDNN
jgi:hypothetical protein